MYKNPKKPKVSSSGVNGDEDAEPMTASKGKGPSAMQPAASALEGVKLVKGDVGNDGGVVGLVNEKAFLRKRKEDVPVDQVGFFSFFRCLLAVFIPSFLFVLAVMDFEVTNGLLLFLPKIVVFPPIFHQES